MGTVVIRTALVVIVSFYLVSLSAILPATAGEWVQHSLDGTTWGFHAVGRDGVGLAKASSEELLFFNARTGVWTEHGLATPMSVVSILADGYLVLVVGQDRAVVFNTLTSAVSTLDYQGSLLSTSGPTRSFDCRFALALVVTDQEFCVFDAETDQWHRRPYALPAPLTSLVRHQCHDVYAVSFMPLTSSQRVNLVYSLIQHDSNEASEGLFHLATPMDYGYAGQSQNQTTKYYFGYSAVTNTFDRVDWPLGATNAAVVINTGEAIGLKTAYAACYEEDFADDIRHYHAYGFDTRHGQWRQELLIVDRTEVSLAAWRAGGTCCGVCLWNVGESYDLLVFDGTADSWHVEHLGLDAAGASFMFGGNVVLGEDPAGVVGIDLTSGEQNSCSSPYDSRFLGGLNYADYLSDGPGEDMVTINCYNGNANAWHAHTTGDHNSTGSARPHVHLRISDEPQREAVFYSAYRDELYAYDLTGWPMVSPLITDNYAGVVAGTAGQAVLYDAHRGSVYFLDQFDYAYPGIGSRYFMMLSNADREAQAYSLATGTWSSCPLEADAVTFSGPDMIGMVMSASGIYYDRFYAYDASDGSWAVLNDIPTGYNYRVGERTAYMFNTTNAYALGTGEMTPVQLFSFTLQGDHGAVEARWQCAPELAEGEVRVIAAGPAGSGSSSWNVPAIREAAGLFRALDNHPNLAKGGRFTYTLQTVDGGGQWASVATETINLQPLPRLAISGVHPNPFNPRTTVTFYLVDSQRVRLAIHDVAGRRLRLLVDGIMPPGQHAVQWDGCDADGRSLASGVYTVLLESEQGLDHRKALLMR